MAPRLSLVSVLLVSLLIHNVVTTGLPSIFGTRVTKEDATKDSVKEGVQDANSHPTKEEGEKDPHHKPTRPPILLNIPHPADHPLHPHNRPDHFLHPDNLPHLELPHIELPHIELPHIELPHLELPHLPPLHEHFTRETIHATKTVFVEVTDKVTVHPVCMTAYKDTPACLPHHHHHEKDGVQAREGVQDFAIQPTATPFLISPTSTAVAGDFLDLEPTRIFGGEFISDPSPMSSEPADPVDSLEDSAEVKEGERGGRWVRLTPPIKVDEPVKLKEDQPHHEEEAPKPEENSGLSPLHMVHHLIHRSPVTHYKTKTLWVTKVEKVLDTRVTATLEAKNCVPVNSHIPFCEHHEEYHYGYHGFGHHHGTGFLHGLSGALSGEITNKVELDKPEEEAQESQAVEAVVVEAPEVEAGVSVKLQNVESQVQVETTEKTEEVEAEEEKVQEATNIGYQTAVEE